MRLAICAVLAACSSASGDRVYMLDELAPTQYTLGLPVSGDGKLVVSRSLVAPADWSTVRGHATFTCDGCRLGDDRTRITAWPEFVPEGIEFGHLTFDTLHARADFADGRMVMRSQWRSPDFELDAHVEGMLATRAADIQLRGCVEFRPTDQLLTRDPRLHALLSTTGANLGEGGRFDITIAGTVGDIKSISGSCELP